MSQKLAGSVCLITGASAGIGKACALALAKEGANLVLTARRKQRLEELMETIQSAGSRAVAMVAQHECEPGHSSMLTNTTCEKPCQPSLPLLSGALSLVQALLAWRIPASTSQRNDRIAR